MGKRDDKGPPLRTPSATREFDTSRLAALTKQPLPEGVEVSEDEAGISIGRAATVTDPLTTSLLAEVARRSQTADFDEELVQQVLDKLDEGETSHPHTRRRSTK
jgi:hypothetical protein